MMLVRLVGEIGHLPPRKPIWWSRFDAAFQMERQMQIQQGGRRTGMRGGAVFGLWSSLMFYSFLPCQMVARNGPEMKSNFKLPHHPFLECSGVLLWKCKVWANQAAPQWHLAAIRLDFRHTKPRKSRWRLIGLCFGRLVGPLGFEPRTKRL